MSDSRTTALREWLDIMKDFIFQVSDDVLRENLEAAIARMEASQNGK